MADPVSRIIDDRETHYGEFMLNACSAQLIKQAMRATAVKWDELPYDVRESLDLIATKISRVLNGDPDYLDNWDDIGGYAKLVADRIRRAG